MQQRRVEGLEIEMEYDERPVGAVVLRQRLFDYRTDMFEEVLAQRGFGAGRLGTVGDYRASFPGRWIHKPGNVLFDPDGKTALESAVQPVGPLAVVGVAVMRVEHRPVVV